MRIQPSEPSVSSRWRWLLPLGCLLMAIVMTGIGTQPVPADEPVPAYDRIEEDWEIVVGLPDPETHAPQIINVISPTGTLDGHYAIFELNHSTQPEYSEGGMQLQLWQGTQFGELHADHATPPDATLLTIPGEKIRYTIAMSIENGHLHFRVINGNSLTWDDFDRANLQIATPAKMPNLSGYTPTVSKKSSRITFASHRVDQFVMRKVRYYRNGELLKEDTTPRWVRPVPNE